MALRIPLIVSLTSSPPPRAPLAQAPAPSATPSAARRWPTPATAATPFLTTRTCTRRTRCPSCTASAREYLVAALKAYKSGERSHGTMHSQASSMTEQDMADVAAYLAGPDVLTESEERRAGRQAPQGHAKSASPATAPTASASRPTTRRISGQHADYIERALHDYQKGGRKNAIMAGMAATLTHAGHRAARGLLLEPEAGARDRSEEGLLPLVAS